MSRLMISRPFEPYLKLNPNKGTFFEHRKYIIFFCFLGQCNNGAIEKDHNDCFFFFAVIIFLIKTYQLITSLKPRLIDAKM